MKFIIRPTFMLYLAAVACFSSVQTCLSLAAALAVHELGHLWMSWLLREPIERVELTPFGGVMTYAAGACPSKGIRGVLLFAAGPAGNYCLTLLLSVQAVHAVLGESLCRQMMVANLSMMVLNLLPALPLDGGSLLFSLAYFWFPVSGLISLLCALGVAAGTAMAALGVYGIVRYGILNLSLLIVGGYLVVCALKSRESMQAQNIFTLVQERLTLHHTQEPVRMTLYRVSAQTRLLRLMDAISRSRAALFVIGEQEGNGRHVVTERQVCCALLKAPDALVGEAFSDEEGQERSNPGKSAFSP